MNPLFYPFDNTEGFLRGKIMHLICGNKVQSYYIKIAMI